MCYLDIMYSFETFTIPFLYLIWNFLSVTSLWINNWQLLQMLSLQTHIMKPLSQVNLENTEVPTISHLPTDGHMRITVQVSSLWIWRWGIMKSQTSYLHSTPFISNNYSNIYSIVFLKARNTFSWALTIGKTVLTRQVTEDMGYSLPTCIFLPYHSSLSNIIQFIPSRSNRWTIIQLLYA